MSVNLKSKLCCPQFFQKTYEKSLSWVFSKEKMLRIVIFRLFFGRIEDTLNCFLRFSDLYMYNIKSLASKLLIIDQRKLTSENLSCVICRIMADLPTLASPTTTTWHCMLLFIWFIFFLVTKKWSHFSKTVTINLFPIYVTHSDMSQIEVKNSQKFLHKYFDLTLLLLKNLAIEMLGI